MSPQLISHTELIIAGVSGDGRETAAVWEKFDKMIAEMPILGKTSDNGYEVRIYEGNSCIVHVGFAVSDEKVDPAYQILKIPASQYASFDVYPAKGYDSGNVAMDKWLAENSREYSERLLGEKHYCVEFYGEKFKCNEPDSIVEIWIPIEKK